MTSKFTAIYVRRSVSDKEKGNNSLSIAAQRMYQICRRGGKFQGLLR